MPEFWADRIAKECIERAKREGKKEIVIKGAASPSGGKHIGNLNDVIRAYFVYRSLRDAGHRARFVHCSDDRDPVRKVPERLPDLNGEWKTLTNEERAKMKKHMGFPYVNAPDPFGCCGSWAWHFNKVWMDGINMLGIRPEDYSNDKLYREGKFDAPIRMALEKIELSRKVISRFQESAGPDWYPLSLICENCGRINGKVVSVDLNSWTGGYVCEKRVLGTKGESEGCGHKGETGLRNGKLSWRFEWPAQWLIFDVLHEPFGKDHAEGSWPSGQVIAREVYEREPPIPFVYEFFLVNGKKMSASEGNVLITQDMLKFLEPEVFLYFYTKKPGKQRDLDIQNIFRLVNEFDETEEIYFGLRKEDERSEMNARRSYEMSFSFVPPRKPPRISFTFASLLAQVSPDGGLAKALGFLGIEKTKENEKWLSRRLRLAGQWARDHADDDYRVALRPSREAVSGLTEGQRKAMAILKGALQEKEWEAEELQNRIYDIAKEAGIRAPELFSSIYGVLLGKEKGPRAGHVIAALGRQEVVRILKELGV